MPDKWLREIEARKARVAVIGLGYVGLPLELSFSAKGFQVYGVDNDVDRVRGLLAKETCITGMASRDIAILLDQDQFVLTTDFSCIQHCRAVIICVPTPIKRRYAPDISFMIAAVRAVAKNLVHGTLVILESATYSGTAEEMILPELERSGFRVGRDIYLAFSSERIAPGNATHTVTNIPKVVGGVTARCNVLARALYGTIISQVRVVSSPKAAEMVKLLENTFRLITIGWITEAAIMCRKFHIDIWEVIGAFKIKPFGFMLFYFGFCSSKIRFSRMPRRSRCLPRGAVR